MGLCLAATGLCFVAFSSTANSIMQLNTENHYRGRVMSVYSLIFGGSTPIGNLYAGAFANWLGPKAGFAACGAMVVALLIPVYFYKRISENKIWQSQPQKSGPD